MNILFFSVDPFHRGGPNSTMQNIITAMENRGHTFYTVTWKRWRGQAIVGEFQRLEVVNSTFLSRMGKVDRMVLNQIPILLLSSRRARSIIKKYSIDVVQCSSIHHGWAAGLAKPQHVPLVTIVHGDYPMEMRIWAGQGKRSGLYRWLFNRMERMTLKYTDVITTSTDWLGNKLYSRFGNKPLVTIPHGVFLPDPEPASDLRQRLGLPSDRKIVATMNDIYTTDRAMGFDLTLQAFSKIFASEPTAFLVLVGGLGDDTLSKAKEKAKGLPVLFTGSLPHDQAMDIVSCCDIYVHSTYPYKETLSLANLEAMSFGRPIVATADAAIPEYIEHGVNGLLVPPDLDTLPDNIATSVISLLQDAELRARLGAAARKTIVERYTWEHIAQEFEKLYIDCLSLKETKVGRSKV